MIFLLLKNKYFNRMEHICFLKEKFYMKEFDSLLEVADRLLAPNGCPWDLEQNFFTLQPFLLEEAYEVLEAIDSGEDTKIFEELGDLLYLILFYGKMAEKAKRFTIEDILLTVKEKLIRRHPHIFGESEVKNSEEVVARWDAIKKEEVGHLSRKSALDGVPERMPLMAKAQKVLKKMKKMKYPFEEEGSLNEEEAGQEILKIILKAERGGVDSEGALRRTLCELEATFRSWEKG